MKLNIIQKLKKILYWGAIITFLSSIHFSSFAAEVYINERNGTESVWGEYLDQRWKFIYISNKSYKNIRWWLYCMWYVFK